MNGHGFGTFMLGLTAGAAAGAALGMTMAPSQRRVKRAARKAAKHVSEAGETPPHAQGNVLFPTPLPWTFPFFNLLPPPGGGATLRGP